MSVAPPTPELSFEDTIGGRLLAWVGGAAVVVGLCFMLAIAVSRGWLGEADRTLLAGVVSLALLAAGVWAHGRRGRTDASQAAAAAGIAGLFATLGVAGNVYELVPAIVALSGSLAVGAAATALAVRWEARGIAALGIFGALLSPTLVGTFGNGSAIVLLLVATAAGTAVLLWQRWSWLAFGTYAIAMPQWVAYVLFERPSTAVAVAVMAGFGALTVAAAVGFELRFSSPTLRTGSILLLALNALVLALVGIVALEPIAGAWLAGLAVAHLTTGVATRRVSSELSLAMLILGVVLGDAAAAWMLDGLSLIAIWAVAGVAFAALTRRATADTEQSVLLTGLGAHLLLALSQALVAAPPELLAGGAAGITEVAGLAFVAAATMVSGRLATDDHLDVRALLDAAAVVLLGYQTAIAFDGAALTVAFGTETMALALVARRWKDDQIALGAVLAFAGLTLMHALAVLAPPSALVNGVDGPALGAAAALLATLGAIAALGVAKPDWALAVRIGAAVFALYAISALLVTPFQPGPEAAGLPLAEIDVRQQGQALLSALWAVTGVGVLIAGLVRDDALLRRGALVLLGVTIAKVFVFDLASLTSLYRAASFVALGLLLLAAAFAWQRIRPRPLPDLRAVPGALR
jgi:uncharacterized membrane protein